MTCVIVKSKLFVSNLKISAHSYANADWYLLRRSRHILFDTIKRLFIIYAPNITHNVYPAYENSPLTCIQLKTFAY